MLIVAINLKRVVNKSILTHWHCLTKHVSIVLFLNSLLSPFKQVNRVLFYLALLFGNFLILSICFFLFLNSSFSLFLLPLSHSELFFSFLKVFMVLSLQIQDILIFKDNLESLDVLLNHKKPMIPGFLVLLHNSKLSVQNRWLNQQLFAEYCIHNIKILLLLLRRSTNRYNTQGILVFGRQLVHNFDYLANQGVCVDIPFIMSCEKFVVI